MYFVVKGEERDRVRYAQSQRPPCISSYIYIFMFYLILGFQDFYFLMLHDLHNHTDGTYYDFMNYMS